MTPQKTRISMKKGPCQSYKKQELKKTFKQSKMWKCIFDIMSIFQPKSLQKAIWKVISFRKFINQ